ncbi:MAG: hypothetical protein KFF73_06155 [Cyclobacteriaceae bacterium]|nr:hypothetical protein [Cyclobacteriaceae bacterium]
MKPKLVIEVALICLIILSVTYILPVHFSGLFVDQNEHIRIMGLPFGLILIAGVLLKIRFMRWVLLFLFGILTIGLIFSLFTLDGDHLGFYMVIFLNMILIFILFYSRDIRLFLSRKPKK